VEKGQRPEAIVATKYDSDLKPLLAPEQARVIRSRPLCPYPELARWNGSGSKDSADNFSCRVP
jgi:hypothetical protein